MRKTAAGGWEPVTWEAAIDEAVSRLARIQREGGLDAVGLFVGNPIIHNLGAMLSVPKLAKTLGTKNYFTVGSLDTHAQMFANQMVFGNAYLYPVADVDRTDLLVLVGTNPVVSNSSLMTAPGIERRLKALQARGGKLVVIDPRRTRTARMADQHLFVRPGTDALLLASLLRHVLDLRGAALELPEHVRGLEALRREVETIEPDAFTRVTGVPLEDVRDLARRLVEARRAAVHGRMGISVQEFGGLSAFLVHAINVVTGNFDREGGVLFTRPALDTAYPPPGVGPSIARDLRESG